MRFRPIIVLLVGLLIGACSSQQALVATPTADNTPPGFRFEALPALLRPGREGSIVTTAGYYYLAGSSALLVDGLSFSQGAQPAPLEDDPARQLWLALAEDSAPPQGLIAAGDTRYAIVLARGTIEGPGSYGSGGRHLYQLANARLTPLAPIELTIDAMLDKAFVYDGQLVRVSGALLARPDGALLVDKLGPGGVPPADARQVKLLPPFRDQELRRRLGGQSGAVSYGPVQVEGFWKGGALLPLGILPQ
jgi:hypothetical protein